MAKRGKHGYGNTPDPFRAHDNMSHYGGVRVTPRTRQAVRSGTPRAGDSRSPLDAIGGAFFTPDLSAWSTPIASSFELPSAREIARAARPATVQPSKRRAKEALFKAPDPLAKKRSANEFGKAPTRTRLRSLGIVPPVPGKAPLKRSEGLGRRLTGVLERLPSGKLSQVIGSITSVSPRRTPKELALPSPLKSDTVVRGAVQRRPDPLHAKHSPLVRDGKSSTSCKPRPEENHPNKRGGGGAPSREFIPWCQTERKHRR